MTPLAQNATDILSFGILILDIAAVALFVILITPLKRSGLGRTIANFCGERAILLSFLVAFVSLVGSLFYSQIAGLEPCTLCWWQRIFLYPQAILLFTALIKRDNGMRLHSIILSSIGALFALYHTLIQFGFESAFPCSSSGTSCQVVYFVEYGYITIPTMALTAFVLIILFMLSPDPGGRQINEL